MDLSELGEFGLIDRIRGWVPRGSASLGIGDDAAVLPLGELVSIVATTDALVADVHFRLGWSSPADAGFKAVSANVSDVAAMGADPRWILVALIAPKDTSADVLEGIYEGLIEGCGRYGCELVGGDTTTGPALTLAVTALGILDGDGLTRSGARPGDVLAVTGPLGLAACGLSLLYSKDPAGLSPEDADACLAAHRRPVAKADEGASMRRAGVVSACLDLSDGLLSDVRRLTEASGVGVEVDVEAVPVAPEVRRVCEVRGWDAERMALAGGEDFELLVTVPPDRLEEAGARLRPVGRVVDDGLWLMRAGEREPLPEGGWDHFRR